MDINYAANGLVPVVVSHAETGEVLMLAYADAEAVELTKKTGTAWFWSRSRQKLWNKGETSGNFIHVSEIIGDCDMDSLIYKGIPCGPACHTGSRSCFFNTIWRKDDEK